MNKHEGELNVDSLQVHSLRLTIELVPSTCFYSNVRSMVSKENWDEIRKACYSLAGYNCEICGGRGDKWPVECHEVWSYDDVNKVQKLEYLIALCPSCHMVKHFGFARINGNEENALKHLMAVNGLSRTVASKVVAAAFRIWEERSNYQWKVDLSYLDEIGVSYTLDRK